MKNDTFQANHFLQAVGREYLSHLRSSETLTEFFRPLKVEALSSLTFWFHRSIEPGRKRESAFDIWKSGLTGKITNSIEQAAGLFLESNRYYESDPERCLQLLKRANQLDPHNMEVKQDLNELIQRLEK